MKTMGLCLVQTEILILFNVDYLFINMIQAHGAEMLDLDDSLNAKTLVEDNNQKGWLHGNIFLVYFTSHATWKKKVEITLFAAFGLLFVIYSANPCKRALKALELNWEVYTCFSLIRYARFSAGTCTQFRTLFEKIQQVNWVKWV